MSEQEDAHRNMFDAARSDKENVVAEALAATRRIQKDMDFPLTLQADWFETPLGTALAAGGDDCLHLLCFIEKASLVRKMALVQKNLKAWLEPGKSASVESAKRELAEYFAGTRNSFETPLGLNGTVFQKRVWEELRTVPYGQTIAYADLAVSIGKPAAFRAVAQANAQNPVAIIVPCHRIINSDGSLGGYSAGVERKRWLLDFEKRILGGGEEAP